MIADNRFPGFVSEVCVAALKRRIPVVLDADEPRHDSNMLLTQVSHVVFSAEGLRATAGSDHLGRALIDVSKMTKAFVAVTDGANDVLWLAEGELRQVPAFAVDVVDTLGAGDTFHGAFTLMLAEGKSEREAMRFAAAAAALKCTRYGGISERADALRGGGVSGDARSARGRAELFLLRRGARRAAGRARAGEIFRRDSPRG